MNKIFKNQYIFSIFTKISLVLLGVFSSVFINRFLGPELKGEYAFALNIINLTVLILNLGIYQSYPHFKRKNGDNVKSEYLNAVLQQFVLYMLIALGLSAFVSEGYFTIIFTLTPLMIFTKQLNFIALVEDINQRNRLNIGNQILYVLFLLAIYLFAPQNVLYIFAALYIKDIIMVLRLIREYNLKFSLFNINRKFVSETIKFGIYPMLSALLITMNYNIDILLLKLFVDFEEIGYYSVGVTLANQVWLIPDAFKDVLFSKTAKGDAIDDIKMSIKVNLYISLAIIMGVALFGKQVLTILYGVEYLPSYSVTVVIFAGLVPMIFYKMIISLFNAKGKQKVSFWILLLSVIINIVMNFIFIPVYGMIGAAFASVLSYTVCGLLFTYIFMREFDVKIRQLVLIDRNEILRLKRVFQHKVK